MNAKQAPPPPSPGMGPEDIYYILFRRKWVILSFSLLGFIAAGLLMALSRVPYVSGALIYISGIANTQNPDETGPANPSFVPILSDHGAILNTECYMMTTFDIAKAAADTIGPAKILAKYGGGNDTISAVSVILKNLDVHVPKDSQIISASFTCLDQQLAKPILDQIITNYMQRHYDLHLKPGTWDEFLVKESDEQKSALQREDEAIATLRNQAGVFNIDEAMKAVELQKAELKQHIRTDESEMASAQIARDHFKEVMDAYKLAAPNAAGGTNATGGTNVAAGTNATAGTNAGAASVAQASDRPDPDAVQAYRKVLENLTDLHADAVRLKGYTTNDVRVQANLTETSAAEAQKKQLEHDNPALLAAASPEQRAVSSTGPSVADPSMAYSEASAKIRELEAAIKVETNALQALIVSGTNMNDLEPKIRILERTRDLDGQRYAQISLKRAIAQFESEMGEKRFSNISVVQAPTPGGAQISKVFKLVAGAAGGGVALGLGLAFLLEMVLDRSFKRPKDVITQLKFPFFLSLPYMNGNSRFRLPGSKAAVKLLPVAGEGAHRIGNGNGDGNGHAPSGGALIPVPSRDGALGAWDEKHALRPFYETLRDRLISYFEIMNLTHRPKLVAVTGCHEGAGVSTIASGLACSLSETGDGNVLLVNMTSDEGDAHEFYKGKLNVGLDDLLEKKGESRTGAQVQDNLYVVKESSNGDTLPTFLPKRFGHLVTKMKASDYDYIIFDMPPVSQVSITPRLARFMDIVLMVVESEKSDRDMAGRAAALLSESRANVGIVMNKQRSYVPHRLHQEF